MFDIKQMLSCQQCGGSSIYKQKDAGAISEGEAMRCSADEKVVGCLFCKTGKEKEIADELERRFSDIKTIVPVKSRYWRHKGIATEEQVIIFPGYIFFSSQFDFNAYSLAEHREVFLLLKSSSDDWRLHGDDERFVRRLFAINGRIGLSKAYYEGDKIRISEGFLKEFEGRIVRVNRRAKSAQIKVSFNNKDILIWLGFEEIETQ